MRTRPPAFRELVALTAILLLATLLRTGWPGITEFKSDEAHIVTLALDLVQGKSFPLQGTGTSVGLPKSALSIYLYAVPLFFWPSPFWATWFTGALNIVAVALCWWLARRYWGPAAAFCATLLFAASPWAVLYSRKIWEPNVLAPFAVAYLITASLAFVERRRWALLAHLMLLAMLMQLHYSGLTLAPVTGLLLIVYRRRINWRIAGAGAVLAAMTAVPFAIHLLTRTSRSLPALVRLASRPAVTNAQSLQLWWMMIAGSYVHSLAGPQAYRQFLQSLPNLTPLNWALGMLAVAGTSVALWRWLRQRGSAPMEVGGIVSLAALAPLLLFWRHSMPLYPHYYIISLPAQCLVAGLLLSRAASSSRVGLRWAALGSTLVAALAQAGLLVALLQFIATHATPGGAGMPLELQLRAASRALAAGRPVVVLGSSDDPGSSDWPAVFEVLLRGTPHRFVNGSHAALFPGTPATLLVAPDAGAALQVYAQAGLLRSADQISTRPGEGFFQVADISGNPALEWIPAPEPRGLANGIELVGYRTSKAVTPGQPFEWWVAWRVRQLPPQPGTEYHIFNHLLGASGKLAQVDSPTLPARDWAVGDLVVQVLPFQVPAEAGPGPFSMRVGMYTYPGLQNQPVLDTAGNPASDAVTLGPLPD